MVGSSPFQRTACCVWHVSRVGLRISTRQPSSRDPVWEQTWQQAALKSGAGGARTHYVYPGLRFSHSPVRISDSPVLRFSGSPVLPRSMSAAAPARGVPTGERTAGGRFLPCGFLRFYGFLVFWFSRWAVLPSYRFVLPPFHRFLPENCRNVWSRGEILQYKARQA